MGSRPVTRKQYEDIVAAQKEKKLVQYGQRIWGLRGTDKRIVDGAIQKTYDFFKSLRIKMSLKDWGISSEHFETMTKRLVERKIGEKAMSRKQIEQILHDCLG